MSGGSGIGVQKTLGELLLELAPGESCPWCGGELRSDCVVQQDAVLGCAESGRKVETPTLVCSRCGSRMDVCQPGDRLGGTRALGAAA